MENRLQSLLQQAFGAGDRPAAVDAYLRADGAGDGARTPHLERALETVLERYVERGAELERQASERMRSEEQMENLLQLLGTILESSAEGIMALAPDDRIARFNQQFVDLFHIPDEVLAFWNHDEVMAGVLAQLKHPAAFRESMARLCAAPEVFCQETIECGDGRVIEWRSQPQPTVWAGVKRVVSFLDVSDRFRSEAERQLLTHKLDDAQQRLLQAEKMAAIGQLAAGVAHEINNPIGFVSGNIGSLRGYANNLFAVIDAYERCADPALATRPELLAEIATAKKQADLNFLRGDIPLLLQESLDGVLRVKNIVQGLRDFTHVDDSAWQWVDLRKELDTTLDLARDRLGSRIEVVKEYGELPLVECLASEVNQVIMNLLANAANAIPGKGKITLRTGHSDGGVWVEIADTGAGIAPEHRARIFEPFFTTQAIGKGTGLGLSVAYGIVRKHGGRIDVDSQMGKGSTFRVWLPLRQGHADEPASSASSRAT